MRGHFGVVVVVVVAVIVFTASTGLFQGQRVARAPKPAHKAYKYSPLCLFRILAKPTAPLTHKLNAPHQNGLVGQSCLHAIVCVWGGGLGDRDSDRDSDANQNALQLRAIRANGARDIASLGAIQSTNKTNQTRGEI